MIFPDPTYKSKHKSIKDHSRITLKCRSLLFCDAVSILQDSVIDNLYFSRVAYDEWSDADDDDFTLGSGDEGNEIGEAADPASLMAPVLAS